MGEIVLETLLSSNIVSITNLDLNGNSSWFKNFVTKDERTGNVDLLVELISRQTVIQNLDLGDNDFSSNATHAVLTRIASHPSTTTKL